MITVVLVDDQPTVRRGLRMRLALEDDISVVGEADDGVTALEAVPALAPDVVVMDIVMPRLDGLEATAALRTLAPRSIVVILSLHDDTAMRQRALSAGAAAFVCKQDAAEALPATIRRVFAGAP